MLSVIYFFGQTTGDQYGNRLSGIENVLIDTNRIKELKSATEKSELVDSVSIKLIGRVVYVNIHLSGGNGADAKAIAGTSLGAFTDDEKAFYDISFAFALSESTDEESIFPIMGYKKSDNTVISWTNFSE